MSASKLPRIEVDTRRVLERPDRRRLGINVNYLRDDNRNRPDVRPLQSALREMGVGILRYPGGEKSDFHLWSKPPFAHPNPQPFGFYREAATDRHILDFDAFMAYAQESYCDVHIVAGYDNFARTGITKEKYLQNAVEWVRYANIVRGYGVKYWEVGNENWHNNTGSPEELAEIVVEFSRAMKAVDPSILIGASGNSEEWWRRFLPKAAEHIDFCTVSQYSSLNWGSYSFYSSKGEIDLIGQVRIAEAIIQEVVPEEHKDRLKIQVVEFNSTDYGENPWSFRNTLGHALVTFDLIGQMLLHPRVGYGLMWNTRWMDDTKPDELYYALGAENELLPSGRVLAVWGQFLPDRMVETAGTESVVAYAGMNSKTGGVNVFLINKPNVDERVKVIVHADHAFASARLFRFHGTGPDDSDPVWREEGELQISGNELPELTLQGTSLTVISLKA